jgi:hypothetical protein
VPIVVLDRPRFLEALRAHLSKEGDASAAAREDAFLVAFDFLPPKDARRGIASMNEVLSEQVAGFYSDDEDRIFVPEVEAQTDDALFVAKAVLAHEAEHALQHRHFALPKKVASRDAELATLALVEGDAQVAMGAFVGLEIGEPAGRTLRRIREATERVPLGALDGDHGRTALSRASALARERLEFPYREGMMFVSDLYRAGGFPLVNRAYATPPASTEQVIHPEKYLAGELPREMRPLATPRGARPLVEDSLGELETRVLLERCVDSTLAASAAAGWDGDHYTVFTDDRGALVLGWSTAWDSESDAKEFEAAAARPGCFADNDLDGRPISRSIAVRRNGVRVAVLRGAADGARDALLAALLDEPGERPTPAPISSATIPPRVTLPEPEAGTINGDVYTNDWLGIVARVPRGMRASLAKKGEVGVFLERPGQPVYAGITVSTRLASGEQRSKTFAEAAEAFRRGAAEHGLDVQALGGGRTDTVVGPGIERVFRVPGTSLEHRVVLVPICAETGAIVLVEGYGDAYAKAVVDGFVGSIRFTGGRNLRACDYLDPK